MLSYHNDQAVKEKYVARFAKHREMDQVIQGTGFDNDRGCFVGCTLDAYNHSRFPIELGWPEWLARLADVIFEGLPKEEAAQFGTDLLDSVPIGINLEPMRHHLAMRRIDRLIMLRRGNLNKHGDAINFVINGSITALEVVRRYHEAEIGGNQCDWSAESARSAAWSVADSADSADSAAWSAAYKTERDDLLDILRSLTI